MKLKIKLKIKFRIKFKLRNSPLYTHRRLRLRTLKQHLCMATLLGADAVDLTSVGEAQMETTDHRSRQLWCASWHDMTLR